MGARPKTLREALEGFTYASDDGSEHEHAHPGCQGEAECDACWAEGIRRLLADFPAEPAPVASRDRVAEVVAQHAIECTGLGEVSCRRCRDRGWMSWGDYHRHVAVALLAAGVFRDEAAVKAEALEEAADELATAAQGWATPKLMKDIPEDWDAHHLTVRHASQIALENASRALRTAALRVGEPS